MERLYTRTANNPLLIREHIMQESIGVHHAAGRPPAMA